jgi:ABC-type glycerol-3-phosphate transport system substrate-binding protein
MFKGIHLRPFELGLIITFAIMALLALVFVANYQGGGGGGEVEVEVGPVQVWGVLPKEAVQTVIDSLVKQSKGYRSVTYKEIPASSFTQQLTEGLAEDRGPDLIIMPHELLIENRNRIKPINYEGMRRDIQNTYLDGSQVFVLSDGLYAYPVAVDPLMMYWNRQVLLAGNYLTPPETWEELINGGYFIKFTKRSSDRSLMQSVVAMGEYKNIRNAHAIISALLSQAGTLGVSERNKKYEINLNNSLDVKARPLESATGFYTRFSNTADNLYSWNRSLPEDRDQFISGDLVFYFGFVSEAETLSRLNPNLDFDIATFPQDETATVERTYGRYYGISVLEKSDNMFGAQTVAREFARLADELAEKSDMVSARRATVAGGSTDFYGRVAYGVAPASYGWLNPEWYITQTIFQDMVEDVSGNRLPLNLAVDDALSRLREAY